MGNENSHQGNIPKSKDSNLSNDDVVKRSALEVDVIFKSLERFKYTMPGSVYSEQKKLLEDLKVKFTEFYKFALINDGMIKRLSTENSELVNTLDEYKKELLQYNKERGSLKSNSGQNEQELLKRVSQLQLDLSNETNVKSELERKLQIQKNNCQLQENCIQKLKDDLDTAKTDIRKLQSLKRETDSEAMKKQNPLKSEKARISKKLQDNLEETQQYLQRERMINREQFQTQRNLQEKLEQTQQYLQREQMMNREQFQKLTDVIQRTEHLKKEFCAKDEQRQMEVLRLQAEIDQLGKQLAKTKTNLGKSRQDVRLSEGAKKKLEIDLQNKDKEINEFCKQLEILKLEISSEKLDKVEYEMRVDKAFTDFLNKNRSAINAELSLSNRKYIEMQNDYDKKVQSYEDKIKNIKDELRLYGAVHQSEEKLNKELQGKLFLSEMNFQSLKQFCYKELKAFGRFEREKASGSAITEESADDNPPATELVESAASGSNVEAKQQYVVRSKEFCNEQQKEMAQLHDEFATIFTKVNKDS